MKKVPLDPDVPLHHQIYLELRREIEDGLWIGRNDFPGEVELAERFGVSVITSRRSLSRLTEDGWIDRGRGRKTRVLRGPQVRDSAAPVVFPVGSSRPYAYRVLSHGIGLGSAEACAAFAMPPGSSLWLCARVRLFQGKPHSVAMNAQLPELGARHSLPDLREHPMAALLKRAGIQVARMTRRMSATHAPELVAQQLRIPMQSPTLVHTFTLHDTGGRTIEWVRIYLHPDQSTPVEVMDLKTGHWSQSEPP